MPVLDALIYKRTAKTFTIATSVFVLSREHPRMLQRTSRGQLPRDVRVLQNSTVGGATPLYQANRLRVERPAELCLAVHVQKFVKARQARSAWIVVRAGGSRRVGVTNLNIVDMEGATVPVVSGIGQLMSYASMLRAGFLLPSDLHRPDMQEAVESSFPFHWTITEEEVAVDHATDTATGRDAGAPGSRPPRPSARLIRI